MDYPIEYLIYRPLIGLFVRKVRGMENVPKDRPFIAAANHSSYLDDIILPYAAFICTKRNFRILINSRFYRNPLVKAFLDHYHMIPVEVGKDTKNPKAMEEKNKAAFREALKTLKSGKVFIIFPEGSRSEDGRLKKAKTGTARIALLSKAPVVPIGIVGSYRLWPKGKALPKPGRVDVNIGRPIYFNKYYKKPMTKAMLEKMTGEIMAEIGKLTGQEYRA